LSAYRDELRRTNLIDTELREAPPKPEPVPSSIPEAVRTIRTFDGTYNDLSDPKMGSVDSTFGRTMKPDYRPDLFDRPNPITVSRELMYREAFIPARSLNILAAAWIQFQVHDWVNHRRHAAFEGSGVLKHKTTRAPTNTAHHSLQTEETGRAVVTVHH